MTGVTGGNTATYEYNGDGDRYAQTVGEVTTDYVLDPVGLAQVRQSARYRSQQHNDEAVSIEWSSSSSERRQRIDEAVRILSDDPNNIYNEINPPGLRHLLEDGIL